MMRCASGTRGDDGDDGAAIGSFSGLFFDARAALSRATLAAAFATRSASVVAGRVGVVNAYTSAVRVAREALACSAPPLVDHKTGIPNGGPAAGGFPKKRQNVP